MRRLADARSRSGAPQPRRRRGRDVLTWDPAEALGVSSYVMMGICAQVGVVLGLLVFSTYQIAARPVPVTVAAASAEAAAAEELESDFIVVAELPESARVIDSYYFFLRQRRFEEAWDLTDDSFRQANYPGGFDDYLQTWGSAEAMEVLRLDLVWQGSGEAHVLGEIQEGISGLRWRYTYVLRFDDATSAWKIQAATLSG